MAKIDKILGSISPLYGLASGQGLFASLRNASPIMHALGKSDTKAQRGRKRAEALETEVEATEGMKRGGRVKKMAKGGLVRGDGCAQRGKTKGKFI